MQRLSSWHAAVLLAFLLCAGARGSTLTDTIVVGGSAWLGHGRGAALGLTVSGLLPAHHILCLSSGALDGCFLFLFLLNATVPSWYVLVGLKPVSCHAWVAACMHLKVALFG